MIGHIDSGGKPTCPGISSVNLAPDMLLGNIRKGTEYCQLEQHFKPHMLALFHFRLRGPLQEMGDVFCHLVNACRCAVFIAHLAIGKRRGHGELAAGEIRVVMLAGGDLSMLGRRFAIERHHRRWDARCASQLRTPAVTDRHDLDMVRTPADDFFETMNGHVVVSVCEREPPSYASHADDQAKRIAKEHSQAVSVREQ